MKSSEYFVVGIDPDSKQHGVAIYQGVKLASLHMLATPYLVEKLLEVREQGIMRVIIEHTDANKFIYARNETGNAKVRTKKGMGVGKNQQAQCEVCGWLDYHNIEYKLVKPSRDNWAEDKARFNRITGWKGTSNKDTRSAAFFGFLGLPRVQRAVGE